MRFQYSSLLFFVCLLNTINAQEQTVGLFTNTPDSYNGYTLFSNNTETYLIDNCGFIINQWSSDARPGLNVYLLENGNLLRTKSTINDFGQSPFGGGFELFDWDGNIIWTIDPSNENQQPHHDIEPLPNGHFLAIMWDKMSADDAFQNGRIDNETVWLEKVVEYQILPNNNYNIVWEWKLRNHLIQDHDPAKLNYGNISSNPGKINFNYKGDELNNPADWIHLNSIDYNAELDQIMLSSRSFGEIWIIDHSTTTQEAEGDTGGNSGKGGQILYRWGNPAAYHRGTPEDQIFKTQHSATWVFNEENERTDIVVFNNQYDNSNSAIQLISPPIDGYQYTLIQTESFGPDQANLIFKEDGFFSLVMSSVQQLPNNNWLICEGDNGHFFEINNQNDIVWEYINPVNLNGFPVLQGGTPMMNRTFAVKRYPIDYGEIQNFNLTPGPPIELAPWESDCQIFSTSFEDQNITTNIPQWKIIDQQLEISISSPTKIELIDLYGRKTGINKSVTSDENQISLESLTSGIYVVIVHSEKRVVSFLLPYIKN